MDYWVNMFYLLIINNRKTFNDIPESIKADVRVKLEENGYVVNEDGTVAKQS